MLNLKLDILPPAQLLLWKELAQTPDSFVLYGGTAIALRLGHRQSIDFDFFTNDSFEPARLLSSVQYLKNARIDQRGDNTLSVIVDRSGPVKVSFFGDVQMNCAQQPDIVAGNGLQIASLLDLIATKLKTIQQRAEAKDYLDIAAALHSGIELPIALAAAHGYLRQNIQCAHCAQSTYVLRRRQSLDSPAGHTASAKEDRRIDKS